MRIGGAEAIKDAREKIQSNARSVLSGYIQEKNLHLDDVDWLTSSKHQILDLISCKLSAAGPSPLAAFKNPSCWKKMLFLEKD